MKGLLALLIAVSFSLCAYGATCESGTYTSSESKVVDAYIAYYGRPPDLGGLEYWSGRLRSEGSNLNSIIDAFGTSSEFTSRYGGLSHRALIEGIYQQLFNRLPEAGGLDYWTQELSSGRRSLQSISLAVLDGAQNEDADTLENRRKAARHYLNSLRVGASALSDTALAATLSDVSALRSSVTRACMDFDQLREPTTGEDLAGIWYGGVNYGDVQNLLVAAITTSDGEIALSSADASLTLLGHLAASDDDVSGALTGTYQGFPWWDGSSITTFDVSGQISQRSNMVVSWQDPTGASGTASLTYDHELHSRGSSNNAISGSWVLYDYSIRNGGYARASTRTNGNFTISSSGAISGVDDDGCDFLGSISPVDPSFNTYRFEFNVIGCDRTGDYAGLSMTYDVLESDGSITQDAVLTFSVEGANSYYQFALFRN